MERWLVIPIFELQGSYEASDLGRVRRVPGPDTRGRYRLGGLCSIIDVANGYKAIMLSRRPYCKLVLLHRLVAMTFLPNPSRYQQVNHLDGNKGNNALNNLEWCSPKMNIRHAIRTGLITTSATARLTGSDVLEIRRAYSGGTTLTELSRQFGCTAQNIYRIVNKVTWKHL